MYKTQNLKVTRLSDNEASALGSNLLGGLRPEITALGEKPVAYELEKTVRDDLIDYLTDDSRIEQHLDFFGAPFSLTYEMEDSQEIDSLCISGFAVGHGNYFINDFEIYAADSREELYDQKNLLFKYYRGADEPFKSGTHCHKDILCDVENCQAKFIGFKVLSACPSDDIARISRVAVFSRKNTARFKLSQTLSSADMLKGTLPEIKGDFEGNPNDLTSGRSYFEEETLTALSDVSITLDPKSANRLFLLGNDIEVVSLASEAGKIDFSQNTEDSFEGAKIHTLSFPETAGKLTLTLKKGGVIDTIISDSDLRFMSVDTAQVLDNNFIGAGANAFPNAFSEYAEREGYNEVYWELEKHHIAKARPHCIRLWFQIDWVVDTEEQYIKGDWQFNNRQMDSVVEYCKTFRDNGIEVQLDFGWKVGSKVQDWFSIGGVVDSQKHCAAPKDLYNYGKAAAATLEYLILEKGCDNVKYITFYNEIGAGNDSSNHYDYAMFGESVAYWASMARYVKYFIEQSRVSGMVEVWGAEQCNCHEMVMDKLNILCPDVISCHSVHKYTLSYNQVCEWGEKVFKPHAGGKPVVLTEFGNSYRTNANWYGNTVNSILAGANHGISGGFIWVMAGSPLVDPLNWMHAAGECDNSYEFWDFFPISKTLDEVGESFYELSLINHYLPLHAQVQGVNLPEVYNDVRINSFYKGGEHTVVVECKGDKKVNIEVAFDREINRKFYRHTYRKQSTGEGNMIVPTVDKELQVGSVLTDSVDDGYAMYVYTTIPAIRQVVMDKVDIHAKPCDRVKISATTLDDPTGGVPTLSISKSLIEGATLEGDEVVIPATAKSGDMLAVKAELPTGEYGISIIRID